MKCIFCGTDEKPLTLKQLAADLGQPYWKLQRAAKAGVFATYTLFNSRKLAFKSQVLATMQIAGGTR